MQTAIIGTIIHSLGPSELCIKENAVIVIDKTGVILLFEDYVGQDVKCENIIRLDKRQFLIPGFVDTHIHAPQYTFTGTGYDLPLLEWLKKYTFPQESKFGDMDHAKKCYEKVVRKTLSKGTTTACYFGTIHSEGTIELAKVMDRIGQRGYAGKVNMDRNSPSEYIETTNESIQKTIEFVNSFNYKLVEPVITPRFVPTCTSELMTALGKISKERNLLIQSHISENLSEIDWVNALHPDCQGYADVYEKCGLLNERTLMAHCIYLTEKERELFKKLQVGISHCPNSNFSLQSGVCNIRQLLEEGITKIGLGTDVGGGYSPDILDAMRQAMIASKVIHMKEKQFAPLTLVEVLYLATLGGARAIRLDHKIGNFVPGKSFDALIVDTSNMDVFPHDNILSILEKFVYLGDDRLISKRFVQGRLVPLE